MATPINPNTSKNVVSSMGSTFESGNPNEYPIAYDDNVWDVVTNEDTEMKELLGGIGQFDQHTINKNLATKSQSKSVANIKVGNTTIQSSTTSDTLELVGGNNVILTPNTDNKSVTITATDTTYESKQATSGGSDVSLVTTGEKHVWNNKQNALDSQTAYTEKGGANKVPKVTTNSLGQVTSIEEVDINEKLGNPITSVIECGGITIGTMLSADTTFYEFVNKLLNPILYPTYVEPSVTMTEYGTKLYAVGANVPSKQVVLTFDAGEINLNGEKQNDRAGAITRYEVGTSGATNDYSSESESGSTFTISALTRSTKGNITVTGTIYYGEGAQPKDSSGADYEEPLDEGSVSVSQTLEFIHPFYYGVSDNMSISSLSGLSTSLQKKGTRTFNFTQDNQYAVVAYDSAYGNLSKITEVSTGYNVTSSWQKYTDISGFNVYIQKVPQTTSGSSFTFQF